MEAERLAAVTLSSLKEQRNNEQFNTIWEELLAKAVKFDCDEPSLPRRRKAPKHIDEANSTSHFNTTPEDMYRRYYFESLTNLLVKQSVDLSRLLLLSMPRWKVF